MTAVGWQAAEFGDQRPEVVVGEAVGLEPEDEQHGEQGVAALLAQAQPGDAGAVLGDDGVGHGVQDVDAGDRVVAESLDAQQAPVGGEADLPQETVIG